MLILKNTDSLRVVTATSATVDVYAAFADKSSSPTVYSNQWTPITTAATTPVVSAPSSGVQRMVKYVGVRNIGTDSVVITVQFYNGSNARLLWSGLLIPGESVHFDGHQWHHINSAGASVNTGIASNIYSFTTPGAATFTVPNAKLFKVIVYGSGGGGASAGAQAASTTMSGGTGGGGGARIERYIPRSLLGAYVPLSIGRGGDGGPSTSARAGAIGQPSFFGYNLLFAYGGGNSLAGENTATSASGSGGGGAASNGVGGASGGSAFGGFPGQAISSAGSGGTGQPGATNPVPAEYGGGAGGGHSNAPANQAGGGSMLGGGGGGCGGGATGLVTVVTGGNGGSRTAGGGGTAGTAGTTPTDGNDGTDGGPSAGGYGGGGGGSTVTSAVNGKDGGDGGACGGGGGGGGAGGPGGALGGAGGRGGHGAIYVIVVA